MEDVAISAVISAKEKRPTYLLVFFPTFQPTEETKIMPIFKILPMDSIQEHRQNCKPKIQEMEKRHGWDTNTDGTEELVTTGITTKPEISFLLLVKLLNIKNISIFSVF